MTEGGGTTGGGILSWQVFKLWMGYFIGNDREV